MLRKLSAIYNVWDGDELLKGSIDCIKDHVDVIIIVYQNISNFKEKYAPAVEFAKQYGAYLIEYKPSAYDGWHNEAKKRQIGIEKAKELGCTHFLLMDCDEYYKPEEFKNAIQYSDKGTVCKMWTYFKSPTLRLEIPEGYYVPFVHPLKRDTHVMFSMYPFYVDRTRAVNDRDIVEIPESICMMHHYSWVRSDIGKKIRNSSAQGIIKNNGIISDYNSDLKGGDFLESYNQKLIEVPNIFNINV